jgi:hypothetical protein
LKTHTKLLFIATLNAQFVAYGKIKLQTKAKIKGTDWLVRQNYKILTINHIQVTKLELIPYGINYFFFVGANNNKEYNTQEK